MPIPPGRHTFGPDNGTIAVRTSRTGAAAKAGHDLLLHVTAWRATLEVADDFALTSVELDADGTSLRVREGTGGMQALDRDDKANIEQTIDDEVLGRQPIVFRSTTVRAADDGRLGVEGDLTLAGTARPLVFELAIDDDDVLNGTVVITQSEWGIKPYSALFGALRVADEVRVEFAARLPSN